MSEAQPNYDLILHSPLLLLACLKRQLKRSWLLDECNQLFTHIIMSGVKLTQPEVEAAYILFKDDTVTWQNLANYVLVNITSPEDCYIYKWMLEHGADVHFKDEEGNTPLHLAVKLKIRVMIQVLIEHGADVNAVNKRMETPIFHSCNFAGHECAALLLKNHADVNARDYRGNTVLHNVASFLSDDDVEWVVKAGAKVDATNEDGQTPLHLAAMWLGAGAIAVLVANGADVNAVDKNGKTPLDVLGCANMHLEADAFVKEECALFLKTAMEKK